MKNIFRQDDRIGRRNRISGSENIDCSLHKNPVSAEDNAPAMPFKIQNSKFKTRKASSLITSLLVLVVLSTIVVAFMQSMSIERSVARSLKNTYVAEIAANAGLEQFVRTLGVATNFHYAVGTELISGTNRGSVLLLKQQGTTNVLSTNRLYTGGASGADAQIRLGPDTALQVKFVDLTNSSGEIISRYAFWAEDESFKQNIALHSGTSRTNSGLTNVSQIPLYERNMQAWPTNAYSTEIAEIHNAGLTVTTANQVSSVANLTNKINEFDYTFATQHALLTPEGHPRLSLQRLKEYVDGPPGLPLNQGPTSQRVQLVKQLLNEGGTNAPSQINPWGYGSFSFLTNAYSVQESRQLVANIIDYIDEDLIPTTDGSAGNQPTNLDITAGSKIANNATSIFATTIPPSFLGQEARARSNGAIISIIGHPFITYVGSGFIINSGGNPINSTRIMGWMQIVNPYEGQLDWKIGSADGYFVDFQVGLSGTVSGGSRGATPQATGASGYFLSHGLAQISGYSGAVGESHQGRTLNGRAKVMFPREWHASGFDLANGWYTINSPAITIANFTQQIEVCRLIYRVNGQRYIVQDLGALESLPRTYSPTTATFGVAANIKHPYGQQDWHFVGDPRINYMTNNWSLTQTTGVANGPVSASSGHNIYTLPANPMKDGQQSMADTGTWYSGASVTNHFPRFVQGYRPSLPASQPAMLSYNEFGFISTGRPWQTLRLYGSSSATNTDFADWRIAEYVDIGAIPSSTNSMNSTIVEGQININSQKPATLAALLGNIPSLANAPQMASNITALATNTMLRPTDIVGLTNAFGPVVTNSLTLDFGMERLYGQIAPAMGVHSSRFTVYCLGQAMQSGTPKSTYLLQALVEMRPVAINGNIRLQPFILSTKKIN